MSNSISFADDPVEQRYQLLGFQIWSIAGLIGAWIGLAIIHFFFPDFFHYPYLKWGGWKSVGEFWPLFVWSFVTAVLSGIQKVSFITSKRRNEYLGIGLLTGNLAGAWEEFGYRYVFIAYALIGLMWTNWLVGVGLLWVGVIALTCFAIYLMSEDEGLGASIVAVVAIVLGILLWKYGHKVNIVYWLNDIVRSVANFTTFGQMKSVLYIPDTLFIFAALSANAWFRDGHKYQGLFGVINSWYAGMILLYATVSYGLFTAMVIHEAYNTIIHLVHYIMAHLDD
jgi:hypothetical protein